MGTRIKDMMGKRFESNKYGWATVVEYEGNKKITVLFDTGEVCVAQLGALRKGQFAPEGALKVNTIPP